MHPVVSSAASSSPIDLVLACDYDDTLAEQGLVAPETGAALERFRAAGGWLVLVTGRTLASLARVLASFDLFDVIVGENGCVLLEPSSGYKRLLAEPLPGALAEELMQRGAEPLVVGEVLVATRRPHDECVRQAAASLSLDVSVEYNKQSVMVLPSGVDKASGLAAALARLGVEPNRCGAVGDAENDIPMMRSVALGVAVANAVPEARAAAKLVTARVRGAGVVELVEGLVQRPCKWLQH